MKNKLLFIIGTILFMTSCAPSLKVSVSKAYDPLDYKQEVRVFDVEEEAPLNSEKLGKLKVGDTGFSKSNNYATVLEKAIGEVRKVGGNALKITKHSSPDLWSTCHRIKAEILKVDNIEDYAITEEVDSALIGADYAIIYVYRTGGPGAFVSYNLHLGDENICRVSNNFCESIIIHTEGLNSLWAKTESKTEIPINIEFGKAYYIRCGISIGALVGRPTLEIADNVTGKREYNSIQQKKKQKR